LDGNSIRHYRRTRFGIANAATANTTSKFAISGDSWSYVGFITVLRMWLLQRLLSYSALVGDFATMVGHDELSSTNRDRTNANTNADTTYTAIKR
jgi:hypothetical protein